MMSMSTVRNVFWQVVTRGWGGVSTPWKYGLSGCMPATVNSADGSCSAGTSEDGRQPQVTALLEELEVRAGGSRRRSSA